MDKGSTSIKDASPSPTATSFDENLLGTPYEEIPSVDEMPSEVSFAGSWCRRLEFVQFATTLLTTVLLARQIYSRPSMRPWLRHSCPTET